MEKAGSKRNGTRLTGYESDYTVIPNGIFKVENLSMAAKIIYMALCKYSNHQTDTAFPSHNTLSEDCSCSISTVQRAIKELRKENLLEKNKRTHKRYNSSSSYKICPVTVKNVIGKGFIDEIEQCSPVTVTDPPVTVTGHTGHSDRLTISINNSNYNKDVYSSHSHSQCISQTGTRPDVEQNTHIGVKTDQGLQTEEEVNKRYNQAQTQMQIIKTNVEYYDIENEDYKNTVDEYLACIEEVLLTDRDKIRIARQELPRKSVISQFMKLNSLHLEHAIDKVKEQKKPIKKPQAYMLTVLYRTIQEMGTSVHNTYRQHFGEMMDSYGKPADSKPNNQESEG